MNAFGRYLLQLDNEAIARLVDSFEHATPRQRARAIERLSSIIGGIAELETTLVVHPP